MRTTLNIDDDLLMAVREVARRNSQSIGAVASRLLRQALAGEHTERGGAAEEPAAEFGFRPFPKRGGLVTNELIDQLREETGD
ncbi:MAG: antitoxin [Gammaproteobacteria bacterium]|nr:antitoxin [Gammaproteobacteria bacterium]